MFIWILQRLAFSYVGPVSWGKLRNQGTDESAWVHATKNHTFRAPAASCEEVNSDDITRRHSTDRKSYSSRKCFTVSSQCVWEFIRCWWERHFPLGNLTTLTGSITCRLTMRLSYRICSGKSWWCCCRRGVAQTMTGVGDSKDRRTWEGEWWNDLRVLENHWNHILPVCGFKHEHHAVNKALI